MWPIISEVNQLEWNISYILSSLSIKDHINKLPHPHPVLDAKISMIWGGGQILIYSSSALLIFLKSIVFMVCELEYLNICPLPIIDIPASLQPVH